MGWKEAIFSVAASLTVACTAAGFHFISAIGIAVVLVSFTSFYVVKAYCLPRTPVTSQPSREAEETARGQVELSENLPHSVDVRTTPQS